MKTKYCLRFLGLSLGASLMLYFALTLHWKEFIALFTGIHLLPLLAAAALFIFASFFRALRLEIILRTQCHASHSLGARLRHCLHAIYIGNFGNFIFPARAGEVLRMYHVHKKLRIPFIDTITLCMVDRLFDVWSLFLLGGVLVCSVFSHMPTLFTAFFSLLGITALSLVALGIVFIYPVHIYTLLCVLFKPLPPFLQKKLRHFCKSSLLSLQRIRSLKILFLALGYSLCSFVISIFMCQELFFVFGWQLPLTAALMMKLCLSFAGSLPSAPAFLGLYQAAAVFALAPFHLGREEGVAYALMLQMLSFCLYALLGGGGFLALRKKQSHLQAQKQNT